MSFLEPIIVLHKVLEPFGRTCTKFPDDLSDLVQSGETVIRLSYVGGAGVDRDAHEDEARVDVVVAAPDELSCMASHNLIRNFLLSGPIEAEGDVIDRVETEVRWVPLYYADPDVMEQMRATYRVYARDE